MFLHLNTCAKNMHPEALFTLLYPTHQHGSPVDYGGVIHPDFSHWFSIWNYSTLAHVCWLVLILYDYGHFCSTAPWPWWCNNQRVDFTVVMANSLPACSHQPVQHPLIDPYTSSYLIGKCQDRHASDCFTTVINKSGGTLALCLSKHIL